MRRAQRALDCLAGALGKIRIELYPGRTAQQKEACARDIVEAIQRHLNAAPEATQVVFCDVQKEDWLQGAKLARCDLRGSDLSALEPEHVQMRGAIVTYEQALVIAMALGLDVRAE